MLKDHYLALDRLDRHMADAFERLDRKIEYHRIHKTPGGVLLKLQVRRAKLLLALAFERGRINTRIRNIEHPPIVRRKRSATKWS